MDLFFGLPYEKGHAIHKMCGYCLCLKSVGQNHLGLYAGIPKVRKFRSECNIWVYWLDICDLQCKSNIFPLGSDAGN